MKVKKIKLGNTEFLVIDFTQALTLNQEVYPGDPKPIRRVFSDIEKTGWHYYIHEIGDHHFQPHGDAPNHQNLDLCDKGFEFFGLDYCFNPAFMIDFSESERAIIKNGVKYYLKITLDDLKPYELNFATKGAVILRTGYDKWLEQNLPHQPELLPFLTADAADYLASFKNLKVVGTDSLTVDPHGSQLAHWALKEKLIVESMVHLYLLPDTYRAGFDLQTSTVSIVGATGGPVKAYAFVAL